jgi:hypothetical protein
VHTSPTQAKANGETGGYPNARKYTTQTTARIVKHMTSKTRRANLTSVAGPRARRTAITTDPGKTGRRRTTVILVPKGTANITQ